jgi:predicted acylesterase/phospholipase RssA
VSLRLPCVVAAIALLSGSCAHQPLFDPAVRRTCLVLSVGAASGVAHIGAIQAVQQAGIPIQCVVGNSMGALIGSLYASAPSEDPNERFRQLVRSYAEETERDTIKKGVRFGVVAGVITALITGGVALPVLAGIGGLKVGVRSTPTKDHERMVRALTDVFHETRIEQLPIPFVAFFQQATETGVVIRSETTGNLAQAVGASAANPLIFPELKVTPGRHLDPGADRVSATPVQDACRLFPDANLLAINVTGQPIFKDAGTRCPVMEVRVVPEPVTIEDVFALGEVYDRVVESGRAATLAALGTR